MTHSADTAFVPDDTTSLPLLVIRPPRGWISLDLRELWHYRDLVYFLTWRDIQVRYKQTVLGIAWAVLQPFMLMVVFTVFFGGFAKMSSDNVPYPLFSFCALLPWQLFARSLTDASNSLVANQSMITKVYFPRLAIPIATIFAGLVDFLIAFVVLVGLMFYYHFKPTPTIGALPLFLLLTMVAALGVGLWLSALNVQYRDVRHMVPFLTQVWFFVTPVVYSATDIRKHWGSLYGLNPMAGVVDGFRWALLGTATKPGPMLAVSIVITVVIFVSGLYYFRRMESNFADTI